MRAIPFAVLAALALLSGLLVTVSLPSFDFGWLAWVGLAPLLFALRQRGPLAGAALGFLFGCAFGVASFYWINVMPYLNPSRFVVMGAVFTPYYLVFGFLYALASRSIGSWIIFGGPVLWVGLEYARASFWFLALPWNFVAHSQYQLLPVIQIADLTGAYGVSFVLLMVNQLVSQLPDLRAGRNWRWGAQGLGLGVVLAGTLLYGWHRLDADAEAAQQHLRVALVQANVSPRNGMTVKEQMALLAAYGRLTREAAKEKPDLIVWPSSSLPGPISFWMIRMVVSDIAHEAGTHLLVGGAGGEKFAPAREGHLPYSNSEFLISPSGGLAGQYNKIRLTPFREQIPLQGIISWPRWITTIERSYVPGDTYTLFQVSQARFGTPICWENEFPDSFRRFVLGGANFMISATDESVFGDTSGPHQTLAMNVFRAVENRVAVARAATTGVSAFIDSRGAIVARVADTNGKDFFVSGILLWDVPLADKKSFYTRYGDVFAQAMAAAALLILLFCAWSSWRRRRI